MSDLIALAHLKALATLLGYTFRVETVNGTRMEQLIRPDGSIAVTATKKRDQEDEELTP